MSTEWLRNFFGLHCSDYELLKVKNPRFEHGIHITFKTVQLGTLAGSLLLGPLVHILKYGASDKHALREASIHGGLFGASLGLLAGPLLSIGYYTPTQHHLDRYDQCYRLRYHVGQLAVDRMSLVGALLGGGLGGRSGFVAGVDIGILCGLLFGGTPSLRLRI